MENLISKIFGIKKKKSKVPTKCMDCNWCLLKNGICEDCDSKLCN